MPPSKLLVIELTARAPDIPNGYPVSVITTVGENPVDHSIGTVLGGTITNGPNAFGSFSLRIYADPNTDVIFSTIGNSINSTSPVDITSLTDLLMCRNLFTNTDTYILHPLRSVGVFLLPHSNSHLTSNISVYPDV